MKKIVFILLLSASISGCGGVGESVLVTPSSYSKSESFCVSHGGLKKIIQSSASAETERCGYRCVKETGRASFTVNVSCADGATIVATFVD